MQRIKSIIIKSYVIWYQKKINKNGVKKLKILQEINESENKYIIEILNIFNEMYDAYKDNNNFTLI